MNVNERIQALRAQMKKAGLDTYLVFSEDAHQSEYVAPYWRSRAWISGFTGSAGIFAATADESAVWVDGRYFLQGEEQVKGTEVQLMKMGEPGVPDLMEWVLQRTPEGGKVGTDGRTVGFARASEITGILKHKNISFCVKEDLIGKVWKDRPDMPKGPVFELALEYAGKSRDEKLSDVRAFMKKMGADYYLISSLESSAWLLNLRSSDIEGTPVFYAFTLVGSERVQLFIDQDKVDDSLRETLLKSGVDLLPYGDLPSYLQKLAQEEGARRIAYDPRLINELLVESIPENWVQERVRDFVIQQKGVKNETEQENIRKAHIKDGAVMVRFLKWVKEAVRTQTITECDAADYLDKLRCDQPNSLGISFTTIAGYGSNGAIVHYAPKRGTDATLKPEGFLLVDSGAQYLEGTTDITRTIALGPLSDEMKKAYTLVLKGHLQLGHAKFPEHITGTNLDVLARKPLWDLGLDYKHGTGHGVGFVLGVHEGPQNISFRLNDTKLVPGMLTSDEPGYYPTGKFGVRIENLMMVEPWQENEWGKFDQMEMVTLCPYERQAIVKEMLSPEEVQWVDEYHERVYTTLSPLLDKETADWLFEETRPL